MAEIAFLECSFWVFLHFESAVWGNFCSFGVQFWGNYCFDWRLVEGERVLMTNDTNDINDMGYSGAPYLGLSFYIFLCLLPDYLILGVRVVKQRTSGWIFMPLFSSDLVSFA